MEKQSKTFTQEKPVATSANKEQFFSFFARPRLGFTGVFTSVEQKKNLSPKSVEGNFSRHYDGSSDSVCDRFRLEFIRSMHRRKGRGDSKTVEWPFVNYTSDVAS